MCILGHSWERWFVETLPVKRGSQGSLVTNREGMKCSISTGQSQAQMRLSEYRAWHQQAHHLTRIFSFLGVLTYFSAITVFSSCHRIWTLKEVCNLLILCPKHENRSSYFEFEIFNHRSTQKGVEWISWNEPCGEGKRATSPAQV